ncbi:DUF5060 domain-containing protein [Aquimarina sp. AD10]|uniref:polysaccharide lyase n=1 Tax=Aquimarina sp. AD10 TaxID=1714849 RepID=UPI000E472388|nr:Ig-like domain-containing protein [Aquimarina sp. AD10]AXT58947.1 DUF5060 domain-containing protein [Aquimarina sp. AD10]RKM99577.1 DUF5060 domain-containing protein [Aquimarina sp. AD10]
MKTNSNQIKILIILLIIVSSVRAQNCNSNELVINQNFSKYANQNKEYTLSMLKSDFPRVSGRTSSEIRGIGGNWPQKTRVINGELRAEYIKNAASGRKGGFLFDSSFDNADEAILEYRVKFDKNFKWAAGGKLPGLGGSSKNNPGAIPSGCTTNQGNIDNGFSCRLMWRTNRAGTAAPKLVVYTYFPEKNTRCGVDYDIIRNIKKDKWYTIKQYVKLNTLGKKNGVLKMYVDGKLLLNETNITYRLPGKKDVKINALIMNTYRGGAANDQVWWSPTTDYVYFDNIKVWRNCSDTGNTNNQPPSIAITSPSNNNYPKGANISVDINANDPDGTIVKHEVFVNGTLVDTDGENFTPYTISNVQEGNYTIKVIVTDNDGAKNEATKSFSVSDSSDGGDNNSCDTYEEKDGLVVMEAENTNSTLGLWKKKTNNPGFSGSGHLEFTGNGSNGGPPSSPLTYTFKINKAGFYRLYIRARKRLDGQPQDKNNDGYVKMSGDFDPGPNSGNNHNDDAPESLLRKDTKFFGGPATGWGWAEQLDAGGETNKRNAVYKFKAGKTYTLTLSGRSIKWNVDRILLRHSSVNNTTAFAAAKETKCDNGGNNTNASITGELKKWHKVTLTFNGPNTSETASNNPFLNYRLNVTFTHQSGSPSYIVPGYYATDGKAAQTSATNGNKWRVHFAPDKTGKWNYKVSFRKGNNVAVNDSNTGGTVAGFMEGETGSFTISTSDKTGRDFRAKGRLQYVGEHYLKFAETGEYMIKQGPDSPENLLAYTDFDNTPNAGNRRKNYAPHVGDWNNGDPTWKNGKGKGLIGAVNYIASEGLNSMSFLTMNINGDDENVYPYVNNNQRTRIDVSKLAQWAIVIEHMQQNGIFAHFKTQETENEILLDNGNTGTQRKLYYRELIARFGHNLALNWNLGEENGGGPQPVDQSPTQERSMAEYFFKNDPYRHHVVIHKHPNDFPDYLTGNQSKLTGFSLQTNKSDFSNVFSKVKEGIDDSRNAGKKWAIACDEPGDAQHAIRPDNNAANSHTDGRKNAMWATLLAGGWGNEWYFGYQNAHSDLSLQDFRSRDKWWDYGRHAIRFFEIANLPLTQMRNNNSLSSNTSDYCYAKQGQAYVVYLKNGGSTNLNLNGQNGQFTVQWYDPRNGGSLKNGSITNISGGGNRSLGNAPNNGTKDWVILITKNNTNPNENIPPAVSFSSPTGNISVQEGYSDFKVVANASDSDGSISNVKLYIDNNFIRQENIAPYEWGHDGSPYPGEVTNLSAGDHIFKVVATDNDASTAEASFILTVRKATDGDGTDCNFDTPSNNGIPAMDKVAYSNVHILGDNGPDLSNFRKFTINWVPQNNGLYQFAINTNNGSPDWYVDFKNTMSFQLKNTKPEVTLNNTGFNGLDGAYWVARDGNNFVLVSKNRNFTIYFSNSSSEPNCNSSKLIEDILQIKGYPNPVVASLYTITGMLPGLKKLQIVSLDGRVLKEADTENTTEILEISELPSGSYFLLIKATRFQKSILFVKQ